MVTLLAVGLCGLAVAAVGAAHQILPRQFSVAQQRKITAWEVARRWRTLPASTIFPASVKYVLPAQAIDSSHGLVLQARRLGISRETNCSAGASAAAARILRRYGCIAVLRATYLDSSGAIVVTTGVAVLPDSADAGSVVLGLSARDRARSPALRALPVASTPAARFRDSQLQLFSAVTAGPYAILSSTGFTDGRPRVHVFADGYLDQEMTSLADGLADAAVTVLGSPPPVPRCPGAPGC